MTCKDRGIVTKTDATRGRKKAVLICKKSFCCKQECAVTRKTHFSEKKGVLFRERSIYQRRRGCKDRVLGMKMQALFRKRFSRFSRLRKNVFAFLRFHGRIPLLRHRNRMLWETEKKVQLFQHHPTSIVFQPWETQLTSAPTLIYCCHPAALIFLI